MYFLAALIFQFFTMTNKEVVVGFYQALDDNDMATAEKLLGPKHQCYTTMSPEPIDAKGHLAMAEGFKAFTNQHHKVQDVMEDGNKVTMRAIWHGTNTGDFNGIPPTGKEVQLSFLTWVEVEDETMARQWLEADIMSLMKQLGAM